MTLDLRRIRVGFEINDQAQFYEGLRVRAQGTKLSNPTQNECVVTISNLKRETRDYILSETSPFNDNPTPKRLILQVGRQSYGLFTLFIGDITSSVQSGPPDLDITVKAKTTSSQSVNVVATSSTATTKMSDLARKIATDNGVALDFQATDKNIANYQHTGSALAQVAKLEKFGGVRAWIDDETLIVTDKDKPTSGDLLILSQNTGMVGVPKLDERGVVVTFLAIPEAKLGGAIRIDSSLNPALNGDYRVDQLKFDVSSHDNQFFYTAKAVRI